SAIKFNLTFFPGKSWIESASVNLYDPNSASGLGAVQLRRATKSWAKTLNWTYATSVFYLTGEKWTTPGGDFTSEGGELSTSERGTGAGWWTFTNGMTPLVSGWTHTKDLLAEIPNQGLIVKLANETACESTCSHGTFTFNSSTSTPEANRPYLKIYYWKPA